MKRTHFESGHGAGTDRRSERRRGTILIIAMVILLILMSISSALISSVIQSRTQMIREEQFRQTALLAEAGLRRAVARLETIAHSALNHGRFPRTRLLGLIPPQSASS